MEDRAEALQWRIDFLKKENQELKLEIKRLTDPSNVKILELGSLRDQIKTLKAKLDSKTDLDIQMIKKKAEIDAAAKREASLRLELKEASQREMSLRIAKNLSEESSRKAKKLKAEN